ncbi:hypothetical protein BKA56DRAFT_608868 [Ilyonectria sp. MPI-CAGE-AT-0026]|nr:hypothetical protein BKA56DRAFT_608868 [Ilyonectria sp. MPI-CAGE-AT-0026]
MANFASAWRSTLPFSFGRHIGQGGDGNVNHCRSSFALVSQEPTLHPGTIKENILLGTSDESISDDEIERATHEVNIYDSSFSRNGFNAVVGCKGALLWSALLPRLAWLLLERTGDMGTRNSNLSHSSIYLLATTSMAPYNLQASQTSPLCL